MRKIRAPKSKKLFRRLISHYILFSLTVTCIVTFVLAAVFFRLLDPIEKLISPGFRASEMVKSDYTQIDTSFIETLDGWVEITDQARNVIYVLGKKQHGPMQYDTKQWQALFYDDVKKPFFTSIAPVPGQTDNPLHAVVFIPSEYAIHEAVLHNPTDDVHTMFNTSLLSGAAVLIVLFSLNVWMYGRLTSKRITQPLRSILEGIRSIVEGQYGKRLKFSGDYELMEIQEHFNTMSEKLEQAERENRELEASKRRMLTDISHDLRTPITTIQGYTQALQLGLILEEERKQQVLDTMLQKSRRVSELIDDFFELSKLESSEYPFELESTDLAEFIRELAAEYYPLFEEKLFNFEYHIPNHAVYAPAHSRLLYRAVSNLLSNALRYNPPKTTVTILLDVMQDEVLIRVEDNGVGIPDNLRETVFDAFSRGDRARKSDGGTGLGLTIAKHIVEKHQGEIKLLSSAGRTVFDIWLPLESKAGQKHA